MAKAKKGKEEAKVFKVAPAREQQIIETLETNYMPYAMSVIVSRAIPEIDGFKPSHRKLLYTMYKMGLLKGNRTKSANVVGTTMKLNPHGDMAIYETMVRLTEGHQALLHPFVDSKGNFGRQYSRDMAFAASRYTEVKLSEVCSEIFRDIDKNTIDMVDNYDGSLKEPTLLPTSFPNVLVNPNQGIAVGMASNICSFNLSEICDAAIAVMKDADTDLTEILKAPDFSTGGDVVYNREQMSEIYKTGRGSFKIRGRYTYDKSSNCIDITEIPYTTTVEAIIEKIIELLKAGKLKEVSDIRDETDKMGLKITIDLKKGTDPEKLMAKIYKMTPLQDSFGCNFNILVEGSPMVLGVNDILCEWLRFRKNCIKRSLRFDIDKKSDKLHLLKGLEKILLDIDKAIKIVRETEEDEMVVPNLMKGFKIDEIQAEYVAEIKLRNLNKEYILKRTQEIEALEKEIAELNEILGSNAKIEKLISKQLKEISKKFGQERKTGIIGEEDTQDIEVQEEIPDYPIKLFRTRENYLKKISLVSLRTSGEHKLKEDDEIIQEIECSNRSEVIFFSSSGEAYKIKAHDIPDTKASLLGEFIPNLLEMGAGEVTLGMTATVDFKGWMLFAFENGKIAKVPLKAYETKQNRRKLSNAFSDKSPVAKIYHISEDCDMVIMSSIGKALIFNTSAVAEKTTKNTQGVSVMTPKKGSVVSDLMLLSEASIKNVSYYRTKNIPAKGSFLKEEDAGFEQISLLDE
ncbi:MAG: topoisomerase IV [Ruminococcaceae bacterium]|nr:topoisomerase IV [Oscillospiraceae bacterium]